MSALGDTRPFRALKTEATQRGSGAKPRRKLGMPKPKKWSHQHDLEAAIGKNVLLLLNSGRTISGKLIAADQYTLKIEPSIVPGLSYIDVNDKSALTFFKSGIEAYQFAGE